MKPVRDNLYQANLEFMFYVFVIDFVPSESKKNPPEKRYWVKGNAN